MPRAKPNCLHTMRACQMLNILEREVFFTEGGLNNITFDKVRRRNNER